MSWGLGYASAPPISLPSIFNNTLGYCGEKSRERQSVAGASQKIAPHTLSATSDRADAELLSCNERVRLSLEFPYFCGRQNEHFLKYLTENTGGGNAKLSEQGRVLVRGLMDVLTPSQQTDAEGKDDEGGETEGRRERVRKG